jgi:citrate lyase subunit beta/citryl-CoA lyase
MTGADRPPGDPGVVPLEDSVAPGAKKRARELAGAALGAGWPGECLLAIGINAVTSPWAHLDVIEIIERAGARLDAVVLPKVTGPGPVIWLDVLLGQVELAAGLPAGRIGIEAQIEDAGGRLAGDRRLMSTPRPCGSAAPSCSMARWSTRPRASLR